MHHKIMLDAHHSAIAPIAPPFFSGHHFHMTGTQGTAVLGIVILLTVALIVTAAVRGTARSRA